MSIFKSWSKLFVLVLLVFTFAGCGGGGGSIDNSTNNQSTTPAPTTQDEYTVGTYTDTYDIASLMNGEWYGISGSGTATDTSGSYSLIMYSIQANIVETQLSGNYGKTYITYREYWDYDETNSAYITRVSMYGDNEELDMRHVGSNTWQCIASDGTSLTLKFTSSSTAMITQESIAVVDGRSYTYSVKGTIQKRNAGNYEINPTPNAQQENNSGTTNSLSLSELAGTWYSYSGTGTATGASGTLELRLSSANSTFSNIGTSSMNVTSAVRWDVYQGNSYSRTITSEHSNERVTIQTQGNNSWIYSFSNATVNNITIQLLSSTSAEVTETGRMLFNSRVYEYTASYTLTKQSGLQEQDNNSEKLSGDNSNTPIIEPEPEPTVTEPEPNTGDTYTDTYDIASILNGEWYGTSGGGTITLPSDTMPTGGIFNIVDAIFSSVIAQVVIDDTGTAYITSTAHWNYVYNGNIYQLSLYSNADKFTITQIDSDVWQLDGADGTVFTIWFASKITKTTVSVVKNGTAILGNGIYHYSLIYSMAKR